MKKGYKPYNPDLNSIEEIGADDVQPQLLDLDLFSCIYVDKVYAHCWQNECLPNFFIPVDNACDCEFVKIKFGQGEIIGEPEVKRPRRGNAMTGNSSVNCDQSSMVTYKYKIPFKAIFKCGHKIEEVEGHIEDEKTVRLHIPYARPDFPFRFIIETRTQRLEGTEVVEEDGGFSLTIGITIITKLVAKVQLAVAVRPGILGGEFCEPPQCEEIAPIDVCEDFLSETELEGDFYPAPDWQPPNYPPSL